MNDFAFLVIALIAIILSVFIMANCEKGEDGKDGADGLVVGGDDDDGDDDSTDDDDDLADDDDLIDDDDSGPWEKDDLPYADECPDLADCVYDNCSQHSDIASYAFGKCSLVNCKDEYSGCHGAYGEDACVNILKCLEDCLPGDCLAGCMSTASYDALLEFMDVGICVEQNCPDAFEDPLGNIGCYINTCADPVAVCCGGSILGCM